MTLRQIVGRLLGVTRLAVEPQRDHRGWSRIYFLFTLSCFYCSSYTILLLLLPHTTQECGPVTLCYHTPHIIHKTTYQGPTDINGFSFMLVHWYHEMMCSQPINQGISFHFLKEKFSGWSQLQPGEGRMVVGERREEISLQHQMSDTRETPEWHQRAERAEISLQLMWPPMVNIGPEVKTYHFPCE